VQAAVAVQVVQVVPAQKVQHIVQPPAVQADLLVHLVDLVVQNQVAPLHEEEKHTVSEVEEDILLLQQKHR
jgi:hypothetical protein